MHGTTLPLPQYAFMAWCSVKAQGQLYLTSIIIIIIIMLRKLPQSRRRRRR
jgi:hypothetical protein